MAREARSRRTTPGCPGHRSRWLAASTARHPYYCRTWRRSRIRIVRARRRRAEDACQRASEGRACCGVANEATTPTWATSSPRTKEIGVEEASQLLVLQVASSDQKKQDQDNIPSSCTDQRLPKVRIQGVGRVLELSLHRGQSLRRSQSSPLISLRRCADTSRSIGSPRTSLFRVLARETPSGSKYCSSFPRG